jgi:polyhydroxyalkanoate synthesis regulator phasin
MEILSRKGIRDVVTSEDNLGRQEETMLEEIKKGLLSGLGGVLLTKEKIEEISRKMVDEAKMSKEDARKLREDLLANGERQWTQMQESVSEAFKKGLKSLDIGSKSEVQRLTERVDNLEKRLVLLEENARRTTEQSGLTGDQSRVNRGQ